MKSRDRILKLVLATQSVKSLTRYLETSRSRKGSNTNKQTGDRPKSSKCTAEQGIMGKWYPNNVLA